MKKKILVLFLLSTMILGGCSTQKITDSSSQKEEAQEAKNQDISEESTDGEADESQEASKDVFAMDTYMTVTAYGSHGEEAVEKAAAEIWMDCFPQEKSQVKLHKSMPMAVGPWEKMPLIWWNVHWSLENPQVEHLTLPSIRL